MHEKKLLKIFKDEKHINEFLYEEFGFRKKRNADKSKISNVYPFKLNFVGILEDFADLAEVYEFTYRKIDWYVFTNGCRYREKDGMSLHDLQLEKNGAIWLSKSRFVHNETSYIGEEDIPSILERKKRVKLIVDEFVAENSDYNLINSIFIRRRQKSIALIEIDSIFWVLSDFFEPVKTKFSSIQFALGTLIQKGVLPSFE